MALQKLDQQLLDKVGEAISGDINLSQSIIDDLYTQSIRAIVNRVATLAPQKLWIFAVLTEIRDSDGLSLNVIKTSQIISVLRSNGTRDYPCREIPNVLNGRARDPDDIEYATRFEPAFYLENATVFVLPSPTNAERGMVSHVSYPIIDASAVDSIGDAFNSPFPIELDQVATIYALMEVRLIEMGLMRRKAQNQLDLIVGTTSSEVAFTSTTTINVTHDKGAKPFVLVLDLNGKQIDYEIQHTSVNAFTITFGVAQAGSYIVGQSGMLNDFRRTIEDADTTLDTTRNLGIASSAMINKAGKEIDKIFVSVSQNGPIELANAEIDKVDAIVDLINTSADKIGVATLLANTEFDKLSTITDLANTEFDKLAAIADLANVEIDKLPALSDLVNTAADRINSEVILATAEYALAKAEIVKSDTAVDTAIDTSLAAIVTASARIDVAVILANAEFDKAVTPTTGPLDLANTEFDKISDLLGKGEEDSETTVNTALTQLLEQLTEINQATTGPLDLMNTAIDDAVTEIEEATDLTDKTSSGFQVAVDAINTILDKFTAGSDPSVWINEETYLTTNSQLTRVKAALDQAENLINADEPSSTTDAYGAQSNEDIELVSSALNIAKTEISRAQVHIQEWKAQVDALMSEVSGFAKEVESRAGWVSSKKTVWDGKFASAQAYGQEVQSKLGLAKGYSDEITTRLSQATTKREEAKSRIQAGASFLSEVTARIASGESYLKEASAALQEVQAYSSEVDARIKQIGGYSSNIKSHLDAGKSHLANASMAIQETQAYGTEIKTRIETSNAYFAEMESRIKTGQSYLAEVGSRGTIGASYLKEASTALQETQAYSLEVDKRISSSQAYLSEAQSRGTIAQGYLAQANAKVAQTNVLLTDASTRITRGNSQLQAVQAYLAVANHLDARGQIVMKEYTLLEQRFDKEIALWTGVKPQA